MRKSVVLGSGIKRLNVTKHSEFLYTIDKWRKQDETAACLCIEIDEHLHVVGPLTELPHWQEKIETIGIEEIRRFLLEKTKNWILDVRDGIREIYSLRSYCEVFGLSDEYDEVVQLYQNRKQEEKLIEEQARSEKKLQEKIQEGARAFQLGQKVLEGSKLTHEEFLFLLDYHKIWIHPRTKGVIHKKLFWVSETQICSGNGVSIQKIFDVYKQLQDYVRASKEKGVSLQLEEDSTNRESVTKRRAQNEHLFCRRRSFI